MCNTENIPNNEYDINKKIHWYNLRINEMIEKQMIFNNYIFLLENLYKEIVNLELDKLKVK